MEIKELLYVEKRSLKINSLFERMEEGLFVLNGTE